MRLLHVRLLVPFAFALLIGAQSTAAQSSGAQPTTAKAAAPQAFEVDYRFEPPLWHTPIGLPGDWHKPLVNADGALLYDFGPGPYARAGTFVSVELAGDSVLSRKQSIADARVPIIRTETRWSTAAVETEAFSVIPSYDWQAENKRPYAGNVRRLNGVNSMIGWANPAGTVDPAFRNVAYGTNRPVDYQVRVEEGGSRTVVLGFADPYRKVGDHVTRIMSLAVEGAPLENIDVVDRVGQNVPAVVTMQARDENGDGWLDIQIKANVGTVDGNVFVSAIWVFGTNTVVDEQALIRGELSDEAEVYVDCGREAQLLSRGPRADVLHSTINADHVEPVVRIRTKRDLQYDERNGSLMSFSDPFVNTIPRARSAVETTDGWVLSFPEGTSEVTVVVVQPSDQAEPQIRLSDIDVGVERQRMREYWHDKAGLPWGKISVPDTGLQALFDGSIRTLYQLTEHVDGTLQTQPGPSVYRGLWASNQPRVGRALTHLGDFETARSSFAKTFSYQQDDGRILILTPPSLLKETGLSVQAVHLHARMTGDREFLESYWPKLERAAAWIVSMRRTTTDPEALNYGLMPAGLSDGGVGGVVPEFTTNYWSLLAIRNMADGARWLGRLDEAARYESEFASYASAFRRAASNSLSQDEFGNWFLPIRMEFDLSKHVPQRSQTQFSHMVYPGRMLGKSDPLVAANMKMLRDAPTAEGLTLSTGWLNNGLQPFIEATRAAVWLYLGDVQKAQEMLYAVANHASPTYVWVEEQLPGSGPRRSTGDVPHSSACSEFINLVRYFIAMEDGDNLELLKGVPESWWYPGAELRANGIPTEFGNLDLQVTLSEDGTHATIIMAPVGESDPGESGLQDAGGPVLNLQSLKAKGFRLAGGEQLPDRWGTRWGSSIQLELVR